MLKVVLRRFLALVATAFVISVIAFLVPYMSGADPVRTILQSRTGDLAVDPAAIEALRIQYGLDRPLPYQYLDWLANAVRGDFGYSMVSRSAVGAEIARSLGVSLTLTLLALGLALVVAFPLGTLSAMNPGGVIDTISTFLTQTFVSVPEYWLAPVLILVFALYLNVLPSAGWSSPASMVLPALVLALRPMAYFTRVTRAAMIDVLNAPYITAARSRGLSMAQTVLHHGVRNGAMPVVTLFALWLAGLLGGSVVVEVIFSIPGMGRLIYQAVVNNDVPVLQAGFVSIVVLSVAINTLADIIQVALNPAARTPHDH